MSSLFLDAEVDGEADDRLDALDEGLGLEDGFEDLAYGDEAVDLGTEYDAYGEETELEDEVTDEFGEYSSDPVSGLYTRNTPRLITGEQALSIARRLNPAALDALDADDADAFLRRIGRNIRRAAQGVRRGVGALGRVAGPALRAALPMIQRVAGFAGPWGRVISAGIGAARGLLDGRGLRGALAGAAGGLIPGVGGRLASAVLGGDGADDDAALDALADMADAGEVDAMVALPAGAGLAARLAVRRGLGTGPGAVPGGVMARDRQIWSRTRAAERILLLSAAAARGSTGRQLRTIRAIGRLASEMLRRARQRRGIAAAARAVPAVVRSASRRVLGRVGNNPRAGATSPAAAAQRNARRRQILRRVPASVAFRGTGRASIAA